MKLQIIQIGNSLGIRIPRSLLKQCGFKDSVVAKVEDGKLILLPDINPRQGWEEAFKRMAETGDDKLLDQDHIESTFDKKEWKW
jgi:antitoxin MazE